MFSSKIYLSILVLIFLLFGKISFSQSENNRDSLIDVINNTTDDLVKLQAYSLLIKNDKNVIDIEGKLYLDYAINLANDIENKHYNALFACYYGEYYIQKGNYSKSFEKLQNALILAEEIKSDTILAHANIDIAILFFYWKNYKKAEEHSLKALKYAERAKTSTYHSAIYNLLGAIYGEKNEYEKAKTYMHKYLKYGIKYDNFRYIISAYSNLALLSKDLNQMDSCMYYSQCALEVATKNKSISGQHTIYNSMLRIYMSINEWDSANFYLQKALKLKDISHAPMKTLFTYKYAYNYFKKRELVDSALYYHEIYVDFKDSLFSEEQFNKISELQSNLETQQHRIVIKNLETKNKIKTIQIIGISSSLSLILIILFLVYRSSRLKNILIMREKALAEEKAFSMKIKLDFQKKEMVNNALYIVNQNKVYDGIIKNLNEIEKIPEDEKPYALKAIISKIQKNKKASERKNFEINFKKSHEDFYKKLTETYPNLSKKDLDLCAFLKLDMSTKEISILTNQSVRALEVARSRLRSKLGIEHNINLTEFIRSL